MKSTRLCLLSGSLFLVLLLLACSQQPAAKTTAPPTPQPTSKPTSTASPGKSPTTKPATSAPPVSFAGKTVSLVIPTAAGGGTDIVARVWARYLSKFLPGNPAVVVRNMPGGSGTISGNYVYGSRPDGLTVLVGDGTAHLPYLTGVSAANYDYKKMDAVLSVAVSSIYYAKAGLVTKPDDVPKAKGIVYGMAPGYLGYIFVISKELLNMPTDKVILAYGGAGDARRAFLAGELTASGETTVGYWQYTRSYEEKGEVNVMFQSGIFDEKGNLAKDPDLPATIPTVKEVYEINYGKAPSGIIWDAYKALSILGTYNKIIIVPPGTSEAILRTWWDSASKMLADAAFKKEMDPQVGAHATWRMGKPLADEFKANMTIDPKVIDWIKDTFSKKYGLVFG